MNVDDITRAYGQERFTVPLEEIQRRGGRWSRRRGYAGIATAVAVAAVALGTAAAVNGGLRPWVDTATPGDPGAAACARDLVRLREADERGGPVAARLVLTSGQATLRVYTDAGRIYACRTDDAGSPNTLLAAALPGRGETVRLTGGFDAILKGKLIFGTVPAGTTSVDAKLTSGQSVEGKIDGEVFAVWSPGADLEGAEVTARGTDGVLGFATAPTRLGESFDRAAFTDMCIRRGLDALRGRPGLTEAEQNTMPPVRFKLRDGGPALWIYANDHAHVICTWTPDGYGVSVTTYPAGEPTAADLPWAQVTGNDSWAFGRVPPGTERAEVELSDGSVVPAEVDGPFFAVSWPHEYQTLTSITAYTADRVYVTANGKSSSRRR